MRFKRFHEGTRGVPLGYPVILELLMPFLGPNSRVNLLSRLPYLNPKPNFNQTHWLGTWYFWLFLREKTWQYFLGPPTLGVLMVVSVRKSSWTGFDGTQCFGLKATLHFGSQSNCLIPNSNSSKKGAKVTTTTPRELNTSKKSAPKMIQDIDNRFIVN